MVVVWVWSRVIVFSWLIYRIWTEIRYPAHLQRFDIYINLHASFLTALLSCHYYWTYLIILIVKNCVTKGSTTDIQMRVTKTQKRE